MGKIGKSLSFLKNRKTRYYPEEVVPPAINQRKIFNIAPDNKFLTNIVERAFKNKLMQDAKQHYAKHSLVENCKMSETEKKRRITDEQNYQKVLARRLSKRTGKNERDLFTCSVKETTTRRHPVSKKIPARTIKKTGNVHRGLKSKSAPNLNEGVTRNSGKKGKTGNQTLAAQQKRPKSVTTTQIKNGLIRGIQNLAHVWMSRQPTTMNMKQISRSNSCKKCSFKKTTNTPRFGY